MSTRIYPVIIRKGESGYFLAECPSITGCFSQGESIPDALENIREAMSLCLEVMKDRGETWPEPATTLLSEVAVEI